MKINAYFSRSAISTGASVAIVVVLVIAAAVGVFYYTTLGTSSSSTTSGNQTTTHSTTTTSSQAVLLSCAGTPIGTGSSSKMASQPSSAVSGPAAVAAQGSSPSPQSSPSLAYSAPSFATQPSFVGSNSLVYETAGNFQWLDPSVSYYQADYGIFQNVFEKLLWFNGDNSSQLIPWLASNYSSSADGKTWTFHLRQGITFADGTPFNSTAVWFSFTRLLILDGTAGDQSVHGSQAAWIIQQLLNTSLSSYFQGSGSQKYDSAWVNAVLAENFVQIIDPYTVQFNVMHPTASFPYLISNEWADIMSPTWVVGHDDPSLLKSHMTPADYLPYWQEFAGLSKITSMVLPSTAVMAGTGPYYLASADGTTYDVVLKANPNYWGGPSGFTVAGKSYSLTPKISTIYINYVSDPNTQLLDMKAGKATIVDGSATLLYSYVNKTTWLGQQKLQSINPGINIYGTYPTLITEWFEFGSNITNADGSFRCFQPFSDWRIREAVSIAVNMTDAGINIANGLVQVANTLAPPGTNPGGSYSNSIKANQDYNLSYAAQLLQDAAAHPLTSATSTMHFYNGSAIPPGVVDNTFSASHPETITLTYVAGGTVGQNIINEIASNLNAITSPPHKTGMGLTFVTQPLPSSTRYTQMAEHHLDFAPAGWVADYNWVTDWTGPMFLSSGTYFSWSLWNNSALDNLVNQGLAADSANNVTGLTQLSVQAQELENNMHYYMWEFYPTNYYATSTWLQGFYYNIAIGDSGYYFPTYSYSAPS